MGASRALSIRYRLPLLICGIVLGVVVIYGGAGYREERRAEQLRAVQSVQSATRRMSDVLGNSGATLLAHARAIVSLPSVAARLGSAHTTGSGRLLDTLRAVARRSPNLIAIELRDPGGKVVLATSTGGAVRDSVARALIAARGDADDAAVVGPLFAVDTGVFYAVLARVRPAGRPVGWVIEVRRLGLSPQVKDQLNELAGSEARLLLGNSAGDVWTDLASVVHAPPLTVATPDSVFRIARPDGSVWLASVAPVANTPWSVVAELPSALVLQRAHEILLWQVIVGLALLAAAAAIAWTVSGRFARPLLEVAEAAAAVSAGDYSRRVRIVRRDEVGALGAAFNGMATSVSDSRRQLQDQVVALAASEARYRDLFEHNPNPMYVFDVATLAFLDVNKAMVQHYGYSRGELLGMSIRDIRPEEDVAALLRVISQLPPEFENAGVWRHRKKDGALIEVEVTSHELTFDGRRARLVLATDVTESRRAERELRAARERLQKVIAASSAVIYQMRMQSGEARLEWISENVTRILGYSTDEALAPGWWTEHLHAEDRTRLLDDPSRFARDATQAYRFRHKDASWHWIRDEQRVLADPQGRPAQVVGALLDVTEQHQLEDQFRQAQKLEAVGRLAGGVAHDFNNLLTVILAECDMSMSGPAGQYDWRTSMEEIKKAAERATLLTRQLLSFSRRQLVAPADLDLSDVVAGLTTMLRRLIGEDVELRTRLADALGAIRADRGQIEQVVVNLVVNARDAMPTGGLLVIETAAVALDAEYTRLHADCAPGEYLMFSVSDTGSGMTADVQSHLFEPFFTTKEHGKGTGLGLATCYAIVRQFGGHIGVYSEVDVGTTIKVYLPRMEKTSERAPFGAAQVDAHGTETILLVEDEAPLRAIASRALTSRGHTVLQAADGESALRLLQEHRDPIHLLLTDVVLPRMGGRELAERVRHLRPELRVLFVSGYTDDVILQHRLLEHDIMLLQKPFTIAGLAQKVREALDAPTSHNGRNT